MQGARVSSARFFRAEVAHPFGVEAHSLHVTGRWLLSFGKGLMGSALMGSLQFSWSGTRGDPFRGTATPASHASYRLWGSLNFRIPRFPNYQIYTFPNFQIPAGTATTAWRWSRRRPRRTAEPPVAFGKGQMGSALMGSLRKFHVFRQRNFFVTPVQLLLSCQKCQGVPFSSICQSSLLLQRPH